jgi:hypothetical protein
MRPGGSRGAGAGAAQEQEQIQGATSEILMKDIMAEGIPVEVIIVAGFVEVGIMV